MRVTDPHSRGFQRGLTRREVVRASGVGALGLASLTGCDLFATNPADEGQGGDDNGSKGEQAPDLANQVDAGELPPVEKRLPATPLVIQPHEEIGAYGGDWKTAMLGPSDTSWIDLTIGYDSLVRWDVAWEEVIPNLAESYDVSEDATEFTFTLREGTKWSDGEPFTADDIVFAFDDVIFSEEKPDSAAPEEQFASANGDPATIERVDELTVRFTFTEPNGVFLRHLATPHGKWLVKYPKHYLETFLADYNPDVDELVESEGVGSRVELFEQKCDNYSNTELPTLCAWRITTGLGTSNQVVAQRNPFYWKTDPDGSQLPYLDRVIFQVTDDPEVMLLNATSGDLDLHLRHINEMENKPALAQARDDGGYRFFEMVPAIMNEMVFMFNLTHKNEALRQVFGNRDFRIGLSHAIDRDELISAVFQNQGQPWQAAPTAESEYYDEEFAKQFTEYDVDLAEQYLDEAGFTERDGDGFRLRPDGERIRFFVEVPTPTLKTTWVPALELIQEYWREVGVDMELDPKDRDLWTERIQANDHDAAVWQGDGGLQDAFLYAYYYLPFHNGSRYGIPWVNWYMSRGEAGEEPPEAARRQLELYDEARATLSDDELHELMTQILQIAKEEFYVIGTVQVPEAFGIVKNEFRNVPEPMPLSYLYSSPAATQPEQYFIDG